MFLLKVHQFRRLTLAVIILLLPCVIFLSYVDISASSFKSEDYHHTSSKVVTYSLNTSTCKIPDLDPLNDDVLPFFYKEHYQSCTDKPLLTYIDKTSDVVKLKVNHSVIHLYSLFSVDCCYSYILRKDGDLTVSETPCETFQNEVTISWQYVKVVCRNFLGVLYQNVHTTIIPKQSLKPNDSSKKWKIFMFGIDSMSKLNLQRTMPKTYSFLENNLIGFKGYNKIEDNTFPNLMAILTGRSMDTLGSMCVRNETFDNCDFIWKSFSESGYVTVYGEDEPYLNTFNYYKQGFIEPPTDFYLRPYFLSAYYLPVVIRHSMTVCTGPEHTANRMFDCVKDFLTTFKNSPTFAFYWLNSFSHDDVNYPSTMDDKILTFLTDPIVSDEMDRSVTVIFSDHGFRFGDIRFTYSGWLEERLPFIYVKFPKTFQQSYPGFVENFVLNTQRRLTTPFDLHMTLQHILKLSNDRYDIKPSPGCPKCKSLFEIIDENRTCEDAAIVQHWCTCEGYKRAAVTSPDVIEVGEYIVDEVNKLIGSFYEEGYKCAKYVLNSVETVGRSDHTSRGAIYMILIRTYPYAMFEATVRKRDGNFELLGQISRLNKYAAYSDCIHNDILKKYCFCDSWTTKLFSRICYLFRCTIY